MAYPRPESGTDLQPFVGSYDLIGPQLIGNTLARCLRTAYYPPPDGHHFIERVYNVHVEKTGFQTVAVELLTILGDRVPFPESVKLLVAVNIFVGGASAYKYKTFGCRPTIRISTLFPSISETNELVAANFKTISL